jgi:hypothetical protein
VTRLVVAVKEIAYALPMDNRQARGARMQLCRAMDNLQIAAFWLDGEYGDGS